MRQINEAGLKIVKGFESLELTAYRCPAGKMTIGYGHVITTGEVFARRITTELAESVLRRDLSIAEQAVTRFVKVDITDNQFSALVSFTFNCGVEALRRSTLLRKLNAGDAAGASNEFSKWIRGGGRILNGLVRRRQAEQQLFLS